MKSKVKQILTSHPKLRDDKMGFIANMLCEDGLSREYAELVAKHYNTADNYARWWRRIQQFFPFLRGKEWYKRQKQQEPVKQKLGYK